MKLRPIANVKRQEDVAPKIATPTNTTLGGSLVIMDAASVARTNAMEPPATKAKDIALPLEAARLDIAPAKLQPAKASIVLVVSSRIPLYQFLCCPDHNSRCCYQGKVIDTAVVCSVDPVPTEKTSRNSSTNNNRI
ncbi:uncharacterized protein [Macrobrachium rosenbergii]|uniref:uncharacterized protein n=1 Tax=Macrobrachium rosenbergii TaxID=79674 RepID=UPI0034D45D3F